MSKKLKKRIQRTATGAVVYLGGIFCSLFLSDHFSNILVLAVYLAAYVIIGGDVVKNAIKNLGNRRILDENFLMTIATIGAFFVGEYQEGVAVMLFYQVGECFQSYAVNRSRKSIAALMDIRPDYANVLRKGQAEEVTPEEVEVGETILIKPGERIPLDGIVTKGSSILDTRALTGESLPRDVAEGEAIASGCVNLSGVLEVQTTKRFQESTVARILDLVENAGSKKAEAEHFITKFSRYYTPFVVCCAVLLSLLPPVLLGGSWTEWIYRALSFLVISCPCALVISIPLSFFGGLGGAGKEGILIKGSNYLEALAATQTVVMDKTGTLTQGIFRVTKICPQREGITSEELLEIAACVEGCSNHPVSKSLHQVCDKEVDRTRLQNVEELAGQGMSAILAGRKVYVGNGRLMKHLGLQPTEAGEVGTIVHISREGEYLGYILIADEIKSDAKSAVEQLKAVGIQKIVMLTGDRKEVAEQVAKQLGIHQVYAELLPEDKVRLVEQLLKEKTQEKKLVFVGDGMNDAPVLARADIGIAMGGLGCDAAIEAADVVIMTDEPSKIIKAIQISKKTLTIVKQNIVFAIGIKLLILLLAALGAAGMWAAVFADVGVAVIAILNAMRAMKVR